MVIKLNSHRHGCYFDERGKGQRESEKEREKRQTIESVTYVSTLETKQLIKEIMARSIFYFGMTFLFQALSFTFLLN